MLQRNGIVAIVVLLATSAVDAGAGGAAQAASARAEARAQASASASARAQARKAREEAQQARDKARAEARRNRGGRREAVQEARETRTFKAGRDTTLSINNLAGDISVSGTSADEIRVSIVRRAYGETDDEARRQLESTTVEAEQRGSRIDLRARHTGSHNRVEVVFDVVGPRGLLVDARSLSGDITVTGLDGETRVETVSGDIVAKALGALSAAKTMSGDVELANCTSAGEMAASSVSGDLTAETVKARSCSFGSISGSVGLTHATCERAAVRSVSGDLRFAGPLDRGGRYEFKSHSGHVVLHLDGKTGFEIDARTYSGRLRSDLPLTDRTAAAPRGPGGQGETLHGLFGDGSAGISVTTFSGNVTLTR